MRELEQQAEMRKNAFFSSSFSLRRQVRDRRAKQNIVRDQLFGKSHLSRIASEMARSFFGVPNSENFAQTRLTKWALPEYMSTS